MLIAAATCAPTNLGVEQAEGLIVMKLRDFFDRDGGRKSTRRSGGGIKTFVRRRAVWFFIFINTIAAVVISVTYSSIYESNLVKVPSTVSEECK